jgi:hypothetical protein
MNSKNKDRECTPLERGFLLLSTDCIKTKTSSQTSTKSQGLCSFSKMVLNMRVSGTPIAIIVTEEDIKFGLTEAFMKDTGKLTRQTVEEDLSTLMVTFMMVTGKMIRLMDSANTLTLTELNMRDTGLMTNSMERVRSIGLMVLNTRETINSVKKMGMELSSGLTNHLIKETLLITTYMVMELTSGLITESILAIG